METLLLNSSDITRLVEPDALFNTMQSAFAAYSRDRAIPARRFYTELPGTGGAMVLMPGLIAGIPAYTVKVNAKFPGQHPAIRGAVLLNDLDTGALLAVMDSFQITAVRTGLAAAMASNLLAKDDAHKVAVVGAGVQGEYQLRYLSRLRRIESVKIYDLSPQKAIDYATSIGAELSVTVDICATLEAAVHDADIVLIATWAKKPLLFAHMIPPGCHVTTLGADQPGEAEVDTALVKESVFVCDDRNLAIEMGAVGGVGLGAEVIDAEIGEIISEDHPGRSRPDQITVYAAVGLAFQDLATAWQVYRSACSSAQYSQFDFLI